MNPISIRQLLLLTVIDKFTVIYVRNAGPFEELSVLPVFGRYCLR